MFEQRQHEASYSCNQRCERWEAIFAGYIGMGDSTCVWFCVDAVARHIDLFVGFLAIHFRIDAVARSVREHL